MIEMNPAVIAAGFSFREYFQEVVTGFMKRYGRVLLAGIFMLLLWGCAVQDHSSRKKLEEYKIVVILPGEEGDLSWNDTNMEGISYCEEKFQINIECIRNVEEEEAEQVLMECAKNGYDLVLTAGEQFTDSVNTVARQYPDTFFCIVNGIRADYENVAAVKPREYEASNMAAVITGNITEAGIIGMIAGYPNEGMEHLLDVYEKKVRSILEERGIENVRFLRAYTNSWTDKSLGRKIAEQVIDSGAETLFVYSNEAGLGCIEVARDRGAKVIGFSSNPTQEHPDTVVASIKFDFGKLYEWILFRFENGKLRGKRLEEVGMEEDIFVPVYSSHISAEIKEKVEQE